MNCLGVDFGTTSVKSALYNEKLQLIASTSEEYTLKASGDIVEIEAEKYWSLIENVICGISKEADIDCMAIDTQCETLILCDENGVPLRDAIVWLDNRATEEAEIIEKHFGNKRIYEVTGQPEVTATWPACKLLWIKRHEPDIWAKTKKIFLLEDYLLYKLTGNFVTEKTLQSSTIYFDITGNVWWKEMLDFIGVSEDMLPTLLDSATPVGEYKGIKVITSAIDQIAGAIGAGVVKEGIISEMTGTTMVVYVPSKTVPPFKKDSIVPCHYCYDGKYCLLSWSPTAGMALKWFRDAFLSDKSFKDIDDMAKSIPVGSDGVTFLPYLCGSTMPKYNPDARGSFTGITPEHAPAHFARSIMESITCMLKSNLDYLNVPVEEIRIMGGGAKSPLWCQMKADLTGKRLITLKNKETACLGSAILAGVGAGVFESVEKAAEMILTDKEYVPEGADYTDVYRRFTKYDNLLNVKEEG
jgi:xylulokinase